MEDFLIMPTVCRMHDVPCRKEKKQFLMPQFIADEENLLSNAKTKSAEARGAKQPRARTRKAMYHLFAKTKVPAPAPANAAQPPIKMTFQLIPRSSLDADDSPVEYVVKFTVY
jgi:hypothetical protein